MPVSIRPIGKKILVTFPEAPREAVVGGIVVQRKDVRSDFRKALISALPSGYRGDLCVGDSVFVKPFCGSEVCLDGVTYAFVTAGEVLAVVED